MNDYTIFFLSVAGVLCVAFITKCIERCIELIYGPDDIYLCDECGAELDDHQ